MKLNKWFEKSEKELLVGLSIKNIQKDKENKKITKWLFVILIINLILNLIQMILLTK